MERIKNCPFCGGSAELRHLYKWQAVCIYCTDCGARTPDIAVDASYCANDKVIEMWNRRVTDEHLD